MAYVTVPFSHKEICFFFSLSVHSNSGCGIWNETVYVSLCIITFTSPRPLVLIWIMFLLTTFFTVQKYYIIIHTPHTVHFITVIYLSYNWKFIPLKLSHLSHSSTQHLPSDSHLFSVSMTLFLFCYICSCILFLFIYFIF